ncbi:dynein intermediate chain KNAG_0K02140 [Huiozyma naganishii CBS 8797]|uniref:DNA damage-binding protein CMR1 n=1 Tax=Huiozyma naganishii (strain ATCC MYA-139 / BCRC 22969 / CBS 8797 / KCTC 17520 / NBRC 10181 / NCYC 3082 / Yp74L-3) TaxID=1071383 RepID=J7S3F4_HUIN7|nr:hypothetical protein KNAG_0K02140 [Kazachstania naganishii CBS 8797]CCK72577.1 hypothetical protein KNAG_0K02140 [Kazachstania naganishii CBS 8797]
MDRLRELQLKRERLWELRDRGVGLLQPQGKGHDEVEVEGEGEPLCDAAVQTDAVVEGATATRTITYDRAVQTVALPQSPPQLPKELSPILTPTAVSPKSEVASPRGPLTPLVVPRNGRLPSRERTFASEWYVLGGAGDTNAPQGDGPQKVRLLHSWAPPQPSLESSNAWCVSLDYDKNREVTMAAFQSPRGSVVYVMDTFDGCVLDQLTLQGQLVTHARILRKHERHGVIAMLLVTVVGKTILYELRRRQQEGDETQDQWERNLLSANHHVGQATGVPGLWECGFKLVTGSSAGCLTVLNSLDLTVYRDVATSSEGLQDVLLAPVAMSEYLNIDHRTQDWFVDNHLSRLTPLNEVSVTALVGSPFDEETLYLGALDGAIYKVSLRDVKSRGPGDPHWLPLALNNNGFLPRTTPDKQDPFHERQVTSLCFRDDGLLLSASLDWTVCVYDAVHNVKLDEYTLRSPIIEARWLEGRLLSYVLTWDTLEFVQWSLDKAKGGEGGGVGSHEREWERLGDPKCIARVTIQDASPLTQFTACSVVHDAHTDHYVAILSGNTPPPTVQYFDVAV